MDFKTKKETRTPFIYKNVLCDYFPTISKWNTNIILQRYGQDPCKVSYHGRPVVGDVKMKYIDFFNENSGYSFTRTPKKDSSFVQDIDWETNIFFSPMELLRTIFFKGPSDTGALPHKHGDALNLLVEGEKRWIMFDTENQEGLELQRYYTREYGTESQWKDWYNNEYHKINVQTIEFIQYPGDIVYVPRNYSHTVHNIKPALGIVFEITPPI